MSKFHVGDHVRVIDKNSRRFNSIGVIKRLEPYDMVIVKLEDNTGVLLRNQSLEYAFKVGDTVTFNCLGIETKGVIVNRMSNGLWVINHNKGTTAGVPASEMKPLSKENNADTFTKVKIDEIKSISISKQEEKKTMKSEEFVKDIFNRLNNYITLKQGEILNAIQSEDKNWQEAQMHMNKLQELHDLYYPDQIMPLPSSSGYFCSPDTTIMERKVNGKSKYLKEELLKKQELITHALQVDENMSSEAVFKLLNSYGLTDECGKVLPVTGELICNLLELPEDETLF